VGLDVIEDVAKTLLTRPLDLPSEHHALPRCNTNDGGYSNEQDEVDDLAFNEVIWRSVKGPDSPASSRRELMASFR